VYALVCLQATWCVSMRADMLRVPVVLLQVDRALASVQDDPAFTPEAVAKQSRAAQSLCLWARAMDTYHRVAAAVAPKRAKLRSTEAILAAADTQLHEKQARLRVTPPAACLKKNPRVFLLDKLCPLCLEMGNILILSLYSRIGRCSFNAE
jgi:hypothetical protein